jgi:hypothetical protein
MVDFIQYCTSKLEEKQRTLAKRKTAPRKSPSPPSPPPIKSPPRKKKKRKLPYAVFGLVKHRFRAGYQFTDLQWFARHKKSGQCRFIDTSARCSDPFSALRANERLIGSHNGPDKLALSLAARYIMEILDHRFSKFSYAFRLRRMPPAKGLNQVSALLEFRKSCFESAKTPFAMRIDIKDFFGSIPHDQLRSVVATKLKDPAALRFIDTYLAFVQRVTGRDRGVLQGSPISGVLANLYLDPIDRLLTGKHHKFVRYADDIVLLGSSTARVEHAYQSVEQELTKLGLRLGKDPDKLERAYLGSSRPADLDSVWTDRLTLLGFEFFADGSFAIRPSTIAKARRRVEYLTSADRGPAALSGADLIARMNLFLGFKRRRNKISGKKHWRIGRRGNTSNDRRGWVPYFSLLGPSEKILAQIRQMDRFIHGRVKTFLEKNNVANQDALMRKLGFGVGLFQARTAPRPIRHLFLTRLHRFGRDLIAFLRGRLVLRLSFVRRSAR